MRSTKIAPTHVTDYYKLKELILKKQEKIVEKIMGLEVLPSRNQDSKYKPLMPADLISDVKLISSILYSYDMLHLNAKYGICLYLSESAGLLHLKHRISEIEVLQEENTSVLKRLQEELHQVHTDYLHNASNISSEQIQRIRRQIKILTEQKNIIDINLRLKDEYEKEAKLIQYKEEAMSEILKKYPIIEQFDFQDLPNSTIIIDAHYKALDKITGISDPSSNHGFDIEYFEVCDNIHKQLIKEITVDPAHECDLFELCLLCHAEIEYLTTVNSLRDGISFHAYNTTTLIILTLLSIMLFFINYQIGLTVMYCVLTGTI